MRQGDIGGRFLPMHSDIAHFNLHVKRNNVEAANLCAASGNPLHLGNHALPHIGLKRIGGGIPEGGEKSEQAGGDDEKQKFPPARRSGGRLRHRVCTPSPASLAPVTITLLSERSDGSHEIMSSLTFSSVSNSRILAATSAGGASGAIAGVNCVMNFSPQYASIVLG